MYKKLIARLLILTGCILGTLSLTPPASAFTCVQQCLPAYRACVAAGLAGCDEIFTDCVCSCNGTC
jgi:hypothetical protein